MLLSELFDLLEHTEIPAAYDHFLEELHQGPPYIVVNEPESINFYADNRVYTQITKTDIRLYTVNKEPETEAKIINLLNENAIPWEFEDEGFSVDDGVYSTLYVISGVRKDPEPVKEEIKEWQRK